MGYLNPTSFLSEIYRDTFLWCLVGNPGGSSSGTLALGADHSTASHMEGVSFYTCTLIMYSNAIHIEIIKFASLDSLLCHSSKLSGT